MSISTASISSPCSCSCSSDVHTQKAAAAASWRAEITGRIHFFPGQFDQYIDDLVPASKAYRPARDISDAFSLYSPEKGREVDSYPGLITGMEKLVSRFGATEKLFFYDTHETRMYFPFSEFVEPNSWTYPDVSVSFPGKPIAPDVLKTSPWQHIAMIIEAKPTRDDDPYLREGEVNAATAVQSARNARNLLLAHGFLSAFVIGFYGDIVRVIKYDHTSALVSPAFPIHQHPEYLQRFLWHFTHPASRTVPVAGADPTTRRLTEDDHTWVTEQLRIAGVPDLTNELKEFYKGRRVLVPSGADGTAMRPFILYRLLDVNSRLFSRATMVWHTIEDTRILGPNERLIDEPHGVKPKQRILKEAWRQVVRQPEETFYKRLSDKISDEDWSGLPKLVCGGDLGQLDVLEWERSTADVSIMDEKRDLRLPSAPRAHTSAASPAAGGASKGKGREAPSYPHRYPQHQTFSWAIGSDTKWTYRERSHMRLVIDNVGRSLERATSTEELVCALRDAVKGHKLAFEKAGVLHRDISVGNILIVDETEDGKFVGFIHDFDYSAMTDIAPGDEMPELSAAETMDDDGLETTGSVIITYKKDERKERTGTYYFIAMEILDGGVVVHGVHHDLESIYWVLVWIVLRHTIHNLSVEDAQAVFVFGKDSLSWSAKHYWLQKQVDRFDIPGNKPLVKLLRDMAMLVARNVGSKFNKPEPMTYDAVIDLFDEALASPGWPAKDFVVCKWLAKAHTTGVPGVVHDPCSKPKPSPPSKKIGSRNPRSHAENMPPPSETPVSYTARLRSKGQRSGAAATSATPSSDRPSSSSSLKKRKAEGPLAEPEASGSGSGSGRSRSSKRSKGSRHSERTD
ncbi:hypothetical protein L226DRAFT_515198 [Lentinus tigrinus ALCF2SS1-7]|uniref:Fungal-type protein kinase domain-containing protein n=1 Tax=Lentinus tigrinus ALCF2SS1-6 TaxID=1328759 RepID=A0A5C2RUA7_9APHY|nr:hypothetical protein L227DRAFT_555711 [Lentinus tigrinus ALCF2SS1-6]RPD69941.1 hypothetical protein L226DRAFT_515198 [Lentinus tigrinus ALCF2SS1-7]